MPGICRRHASVRNTQLCVDTHPHTAVKRLKELDGDTEQFNVCFLPVEAKLSLF